MKTFKFAVTALLGLVLSVGAFTASAQNKFVNDQLDNNAATSGAKTINVSEVFMARLPAGSTTVTITKLDGTTQTWAGGWTIFDRFVSGSRSSGADFNYYQEASTGDHVKIGYGAIAGTQCATSPYGGTTRYDVTMTKKATAGGGTATANALNSSLCYNFN